MGSRTYITIGAAVVAFACSRARDAEPVAQVTLTGAGATFPYPLYRVWFAEYGQRTGTRINYFAVGSAEGMRLLGRGEADFGATDKPVMPASDASTNGCARVAVPMVRGPIAIAYNLSLESSRQVPLNFDAALLADVFAGKVRQWNAPEVKALNRDVRLPATPITVVHRGTGSGTSRAFGDFLSSSGRWEGSRIGDTSEVRWPVGVAAEGNAGVALEVKVTVGAIGYMELSYARQNRLSIAAVKGGDGKFLAPGSALPDYPIMANTWLLIDPVHMKPERGRPLVAFVRWALTDGAEQARDMEYTPIAADSVSRYDAILDKIDFARCVAR
ncbi:MAG: phosphate ABC transporter substrate-binding protein PstS [bacterium]